jgi:predicted HAD superfamily hydrolase
VTKEDFKHTVLNRLVLKKEISEREIDMFLQANPRLQDKEIVTLDDFMMLFSASITQARHDALDQEALNNATIKRFQ